MSDWSGTSEIYAVDPVSRRHGQVTFGRARGCAPQVPCGYVDPLPSPNGQRLLFSDKGDKPAWLFVARGDGSDRRRLGELKPYADPYAAWSPDSRRIAFAEIDGIHVVTADGTGDRRVDHGHYDNDPAWSADGGSLAFTRSPNILCRLRESACSVGELAEAIGMEQSAVSHQLRVLRHLGLVIGERQGRRIVYALHDSHVGVLLEEAVYHVEHVRLGYPLKPGVAAAS